MPNVVHAIEGRKLTVRDAEDNPETPREITEYTIAPNAEVEIDGRKKCTLSQLKLGDEVIVGNGNARDGFRTVVAKRLHAEHRPTAPDDLSQPKVLRLEGQPAAEHPVNEPLAKLPTDGKK